MGFREYVRNAAALSPPTRSKPDVEPRVLTNVRKLVRSFNSYPFGRSNYGARVVAVSAKLLEIGASGHVSNNVC